MSGSSTRGASPRWSELLVAAGMLAMLGAPAIDLLVLELPLLRETPPAFDGPHLLRTLLIAFGSALIVGGFAMPAGSRHARGGAPGATDTWRGWGILSWKTDERAGAELAAITVKQLAFLATLIVSTFFVYLFVRHRLFFHKLSAEDNPVEAASAALLFASAAIFAVAGRRLRRGRGRPIKGAAPFSFAVAVLLFVIGMEEVSWFQRVFEIRTPELFRGNLQNEMNLHNFATNLTENLYYFCSFLALVLVPHAIDRLGLARANGFVALFTPSRFIVLTSAIITAYNYDMWNIAFSQASFFLALFILAERAWLRWQQTGRVPAFTLAIVLLILTQTVFLLYGGYYEKYWIVTEYKEFFIPLCFFLYAMEVLQRTKRAEWARAA